MQNSAFKKIKIKCKAEFHRKSSFLTGNRNETIGIDLIP